MLSQGPLSFDLESEVHEIVANPNVIVRNNPKYTDRVNRDDKHLVELF